MVRARIYINTGYERNKKKVRVNACDLQKERITYNSYIEKEQQPAEILEKMELNELTKEITSNVRLAAMNIQTRGRKSSKISKKTSELQER